YGFVEQFAQRASRLFFRFAGWPLLTGRQLPVAAIAPMARRAEREPAAGRKLPDLAVRRSGLRNIAELQIQPQSVAIEIERRPRGAQAFQFASEPQAPRQQGVVERLLAEAIAGQQEFAPARIPDGKRKHPAKPGDAGLRLI